MRLQDVSYCDRYGNCLPSLFGSTIPLISYAITFLLFLLFSLDSLQPDTIQEKLQVVTFTLTNLAVRVLAFVLSLAFLGHNYTTVFIIAVLILDAVFIHCVVNIPVRFNQFTSWILSPVTTVLVVEDISRKEQNNTEELKTPKEVKTVEKALLSLSLFNLAIFTCYTLVITLMIYFNLLHTDQNNILDQQQILDIFLCIFLPLVGLNALSCLLMFSVPDTSSNESVRTLNTVLSVLTFTATILCPLLAGVLVIPASPREVFILARGPDSLLLYSVRTHSNYSWDISQYWTFNQSSLSLQSDETEETLSLQFRPDVNSQLCLTRNITQSDIEALNEREINIAEKINPINWEGLPFR